jgi:hypothetical protein
MDDPLQKKCDQLVKSLMKRSQGVHFSRPLEWKKMGLTDYPKLVKDPMDLGTISERTSKGYYSRLEQFAHDVRLVWVRLTRRSPSARARAPPRLARSPPRDHLLTAVPPALSRHARCGDASQKNAFIFNPSDSVYFKAAKTLSDVFEKRCARPLHKSAQKRHSLALAPAQHAHLPIYSPSHASPPPSARAFGAGSLSDAWFRSRRVPLRPFCVRSSQHRGAREGDRVRRAARRGFDGAVQLAAPGSQDEPPR